MNSLGLYYSYIKNPYSTSLCTDKDLRLVFHPPCFMLKVNNSAHTQHTAIIVLGINILFYFPVIDYYFNISTFEYILDSARSPPAFELAFSKQLDMPYNGATT